MAGISMPQPDPQAEKRERERTSLQDVMEMATLFFQDQLQTALGARARAYLRDRGLTGRTIETSGLVLRRIAAMLSKSIWRARVWRASRWRPAGWWCMKTYRFLMTRC